MNYSKKIIRIEKECSFKYKEKGSLFHGFAFQILSKDEADAKLSALRKKYYDATHHCYAYKTSLNEEKYSDDGEPNGTAGIRILNSINHFSLVDILVVVVRYFGGTKLGVGPLGKAYAETSMTLLKNANLIELTEYQEMKITYDFESTSQIHHLISKFNMKKINNSFEEKPVLYGFIQPFLIDDFKLEITNSTKGQVKIDELNNRVYLE